MMALKIAGLWLGLIVARVLCQIPVQMMTEGGGIVAPMVNGILSLSLTIAFIVAGVKWTKKLRRPNAHPSGCSCLGCYQKSAGLS